MAWQSSASNIPRKLRFSRAPKTSTQSVQMAVATRAGEFTQSQYPFFKHSFWRWMAANLQLSAMLSYLVADTGVGCAVTESPTTAKSFASSASRRHATEATTSAFAAPRRMRSAIRAARKTKTGVEG